MSFISRGNVIESDQGFSIEVFSRTGLMYSEGGKRIFIDSEILTSGPPLLIMVIKGSIRRWGRFHLGRAISEEKREQIIDNIREAFHSQGMEIEIV